MIVGSKACPNDCELCISKMTPDYGIGLALPPVNWDRFETATRMALAHGAENALITGKGEPTLYPGQVTQYLIRLKDKPFSAREIQTEGSQLARGGLYNDFLTVWRELGLDTVAVSMYHYDMEKNQNLYRPRDGKFYDIPDLVDKLHEKDLNTRLSCVLMKGYVGDVDEVKNLIQFAKENKVFQLTLRSTGQPEKSLDQRVADFVDAHTVSQENLAAITEFLEKEGSFCYSLPHGANVYEVYGQNVCMTTCMTTPERNEDKIRQLIWFPQGWLTTSWENVQGGRLL